jgi:membrane associated rhomboid family serine protease
LIIILLNVLAFGFELTLGAERVEGFITDHALIPARDYVSPWLSRETLTEWARPYFTSMFLHGGFLHILSNMWSFWIFGDNVEGSMGKVRFVIFYLLCGIAAALAHAYLNPTSTLPVVGASGAIAGVMGAYLLLFPRAHIHMLALLIFWPIFFRIPAFVFLIFWFGGQLISAGNEIALERAGVQDVGGIAFAAHIGGFLAGMVLMPFFRLKGAAARRR